MSVRFIARELFGNLKLGNSGEAKLVVHNVDSKYTVHCKLTMSFDEEDDWRMNPRCSLQILSPRIQSCQFIMRAHWAEAIYHQNQM